MYLSHDDNQKHDPIQNVKLLICQIPSTMDEEGVYQYVSQYCYVERVKVIRDSLTKKHKRTGSICAG